MVLWLNIGKKTFLELLFSPGLHNPSPFVFGCSGWRFKPPLWWEILHCEDVFCIVTSCNALWCHVLHCDITMQGNIHNIDLVIFGNLRSIFSINDVFKKSAILASDRHLCLYWRMWVWLESVQYILSYFGRTADRSAQGGRDPDYRTAACSNLIRARHILIRAL